MSCRAQQLLSLGQSVWLDFIRRDALVSGEFDRQVREDGVVGVTSNPTIFQQALAKSADYDEGLRAHVAAGLAGEKLFETLAIEDIRMACDRLKGVYEGSGGMDGRVSIEVSPRLANDSGATLAAAQHLHAAVGRPNVMIKIPATRAGLAAIRAAIGAGISINVTLIFSLQRYREVMDAYLGGLEQLVAAGGDPGSVRSVASFFVSRVDNKVDAAINDRLAALAPGAPDHDELAAARGHAAVANARLAYAAFEETFAQGRFGTLKAKGAHVQRPLWASTSTKNPAYRDVLYVEELIGPDTVNTIPPQTLVAFNDHGVVEARIRNDVAGARALFARLPQLGVPVDELIDQLEDEGVKAFAKSYDELLAALDARVRDLKPQTGASA